jgi:hypothetical protein
MPTIAPARKHIKISRMNDGMVKVSIQIKLFSLRFTHYNNTAYNTSNNERHETDKDDSWNSECDHSFTVTYLL